MRKKSTILFLVITVLLVLLSLSVGPLDVFTHGYYSEEPDVTQIAAEDFTGELDLADGDYVMQFSPQKTHMAGFELYLKNQPDGNTGTLLLTVSDSAGRTLDEISVDLSAVTEASWYKVYTSARLKQGQTYQLRIAAGSCTTVPQLQAVQSDYLPEENLDGTALIAFAYAESTFTAQDKILIRLFAIALWLFLAGHLLPLPKKERWKTVSAILFMTSVLAWNYMYNSMDTQNESFDAFQSEGLVTNVIHAAQDGEYFRNADEYGYGLGFYDVLEGDTTDDLWLNGYSRTECAVLLSSNDFTKEVAVTGNQLAFENGDVLEITGISDDGTNITVRLNGTAISSAKNGPLEQAVFLDADGNALHKGLLTAYVSQYGLQGKIFKHLALLMNSDDAVLNLNLLCALLTALVFTLIVYMLAKKYNYVLAGCFFVTFWLSPWVVNYARNLYWVEFTWFVPMAIGLFCAWKISDRRCRIIAYITAFLAITVKCLCGYEYITSVMLGLIAFLLTDLIKAFLERDRAQAVLLFRTTFIMGVAALCGFMAAICMHALLKADGSLLAGIRTIFEQDVLRRTAGADLNDFDPKYWDSFNASVWEVFCKYFHFSTEVITGIPGNLFPLLCIVPLCILGSDASHKKLNIETAAFYVVFFLTAVSWFVLAKSHSYIHTHLNFVLWYFGFVQVCFYIIVRKVIELWKQKKGPAD